MATSETTSVPRAGGPAPADGDPAGKRLRPRRDGGRSRWKEVAIPVVVFLVLASAWEFGVEALEITPVILPQPSRIWTALTNLVSAGLIQEHFSITFQQALIGFLIGLALGIVSGSLISLYPILETAMSPYILAIYATPKIAIAPLLIIWVGLGMTSKILIAALIAWMPIMINVQTGLRAMDPERIELLRAMGANRWQVLTSLRIPSALPYLFAGIQQAVLLALLGSIAAEFVSARAGLGYLLVQRMALLDTASVFAILFILSAMGLVLYFTARFIQRKVVFWVQE